MLSNATIRNFLRLLEPFLGVFPAGVRMVVVVANLPPTDSYKRCKKKIRIMIVITKQFFVSLKLEKSIRNNLQGPQRLLDFGKELHLGKPDELEVVEYIESINQQISNKLPNFDQKTLYTVQLIN